METTDESTSPEVIGDGRTVWINAPTGECLGRFSVWGIDIHRSMSEQLAGKGQCLDCTHARPTYDDWLRFKDGMNAHFGVMITETHRPTWLQWKQEK